MIVLDEQLDDSRLEEAIARWYKGTVINIARLRPQTLINDDAMPTLLRKVQHPTFVTINYTDFWKIIPASPAYCIICLKLAIQQKFQVPDLVRELLRRPEFSTKRARMGSVISVAGRGISFYPAP